MRKQRHFGRFWMHLYECGRQWEPIMEIEWSPATRIMRRARSQNYQTCQCLKEQLKLQFYKQKNRQKAKTMWRRQWWRQKCHSPWVLSTYRVCTSNNDKTHFLLSRSHLKMHLELYSWRCNFIYIYILFIVCAAKPFQLRSPRICMAATTALIVFQLMNARSQCCVALRKIGNYIRFQFELKLESNAQPLMSHCEIVIRLRCALWTPSVPSHTYWL